MSLLSELVKIYKANPFHAKDGTFSSMSNATFVSSGDKFKTAIGNYKSAREEYGNEFRKRHGVTLDDYENSPEFDKIRQRENEAKSIQSDLKKLEKKGKKDTPEYKKLDNKYLKTKPSQSAFERAIKIGLKKARNRGADQALKYLKTGEIHNERGQVVGNRFDNAQKSELLADLVDIYSSRKYDLILKKKTDSKIKKQESQQVSIKKQDAERQVVWGELYAPNRLDSDNEFMSKQTLEDLQMTIAKSGFKLPVDLDHKNVSQNDAHIVECFIARKGDPDFIEGSLVVGLHIPNKELWNEVKHGRYNGFSIEALVNKQDREVEVEIPDVINGETKETDGHYHDFTANLDIVNGKVIFKSSETMPCKKDGHVHKIQRRSATEFANGHNHKLSISDYLKIKE